MGWIVPTYRKVQLASVASFVLCSARHAVRLDHKVRVLRGGVQWELDLKEGIDLAVYLNSYQRMGRYLRERVLRPGMTAIDIGANVGAFTLPLARMLGSQGRVIAIEATQYAFGKLKENISLNPELGNRVIPVQAVLGSGQEPPSARGIYASWPLDSSSEEQHPTHRGRLMSTDGAHWTTLDDLLDSVQSLLNGAKLDFVKLDVDGNELQVLRGARRSLLRMRPSLLVEIAPYVQNERTDGLSDLLREIDGLGYRLRRAEDGAPLKCSAATMMRLIPFGAGVDVLCSPV